MSPERSSDVHTVTPRDLIEMLDGEQFREGENPEEVSPEPEHIEALERFRSSLQQFMAITGKGTKTPDERENATRRTGKVHGSGKCDVKLIVKRSKEPVQPTAADPRAANSPLPVSNRDTQKYHKNSYEETLFDDGDNRVRLDPTTRDFRPENRIGNYFNELPINEDIRPQLD